MNAFAALLLLLPLQDSKEALEARAKELEEAIRAAGAADTVVLKDGRKLQGKIEEETADALKLKGKLGSMRFDRADVARIEKSPAGTFLDRLGAARGKPAELAGLMDWAAANGLPQGRDLCACLILALDPGHAKAKSALSPAASGSAGPPGGPERDVIHLKDGSRKEGLILSESSSEIVLEVILKGSKGETMGVAKTLLRADQVARVERLSPEQRTRMRARVNAFGDRAKLQAEAFAKIRFKETRVGTLNAVETETEAFVLTAACDDQTAKETAHALNQMFEAFRTHFGTPKTPARKIQVLFLASRAQYDQYQEETRGVALMNPASFSLKDNRIVAWNAVQSIEAMVARDKIRQAEGEVEEARKKLAALEDDLDRQIRELKKQLDDEAARLRKLYQDTPGADAEITRQKRKVEEAIKKQEQLIKDEMTRRRRALNEQIQGLDAVLLHNRRVLAAQSKDMYETLFHEAFHAFAANYLWTKTDNAELPRWLHEGLAMYYERSAIEAGELVHGGTHPKLVELVKKSPLALEEVLRAGPEIYQVSHAGQAKESTVQYASAWTVAHWLMAKGTTKEQFEAYARASVAGDPRKAFETLGGKPLAQLDTDWRLHVGKMK